MKTVKNSVEVDKTDVSELEWMSPIKRLTKDLKNAAITLSSREARYLVDSYYMMQEQRKRSANQVLSMEGAEPHALLSWFLEQTTTLENQIKRALDAYTSSHMMGTWMREIYGIGPVISAGLLAHIDIEQAPTAGHIWRYAGLDPTSKWLAGEKRPWNAQLKVICWKAGQSFMKFSKKEQCRYGHLYLERKAYEIARNDSGGNTEVAAKLLTEKKWSKGTEAYKSLIIGKLPPGQIDARARRYAVKIFISHLQAEWYRRHFKKEPPAPYAIAILGHAHMIEP